MEGRPFNGVYMQKRGQKAGIKFRKDILVYNTYNNKALDQLPGIWQFSDLFQKVTVIRPRSGYFYHYLFQPLSAFKTGGFDPVLLHLLEKIFRIHARGAGGAGHHTVVLFERFLDKGFLKAFHQGLFGILKRS